VTGPAPGRAHRVLGLATAGNGAAVADITRPVLPFVRRLFAAPAGALIRLSDDADEIWEPLLTDRPGLPPALMFDG